MSTTSNDKGRRGRAGRKAIQTVQGALANMGTVLSGEEIATCVSLYLEYLVHEANRVAGRPDTTQMERQMARRTARVLQWFADTATDGGNEMMKGGG